MKTKFKLPVPFCDEPGFFIVFTLGWFGCFLIVPLGVLVREGILSALFMAAVALGMGSIYWIGGCVAAYVFCKSTEGGSPAHFRPEGPAEILSRLLPSRIRASMFEPAYNDEKAEYLLKMAKSADLNERLVLMRRFKFRTVLMVGQCVVEAAVDSARGVRQLFFR